MRARWEGRDSWEHLGFSSHRQLGDPWENPLRTGVTLLGASPMTLSHHGIFLLTTIGLMTLAFSVRFIHFNLSRSKVSPLVRNFPFSQSSPSKDSGTLVQLFTWQQALLAGYSDFHMPRWKALPGSVWQRILYKFLGTEVRTSSGGCKSRGSRGESFLAYSSFCWL